MTARWAMIEPDGACRIGHACHRAYIPAILTTELVRGGANLYHPPTLLRSHGVTGVKDLLGHEEFAAILQCIPDAPEPREFSWWKEPIEPMGLWGTTGHQSTVVTATIEPQPPAIFAFPPPTVA